MKDQEKKRKNTIFLYLLVLFSACTPSGVKLQSVKTPSLEQPAPTEQDISPMLSAEALSEIIWVSDPSLPQYDPQSSAYTEFPDVVNQISEMGINGIDAADDLAVAIRYPRSDSYLAAQALLNLGVDITRTTIPLLIDNLGYENPEVRIYSLVLLASVGNSASCAVGYIAPFLWDSNPIVRSITALALEKITEKDLVLSNYEIAISPLFVSDWIVEDIPEGKVVEEARKWWDTQGAKIDWHSEYGICDP